MDSLSDDTNNNNNIKWQPIITSEVGRISSSQENMKMIIPEETDCKLTLEDTHYHIIGNGQMVNEWKAGLADAGVPDSKVTVEMYFNHKSLPDVDAVNRIAQTISSSVS